MLDGLRCTLFRRGPDTIGRIRGRSQGWKPMSVALKVEGPPFAREICGGQRPEFVATISVRGKPHEGAPGSSRAHRASRGRTRPRSSTGIDGIRRCSPRPRVRGGSRRPASPDRGRRNRSGSRRSGRRNPRGTCRNSLLSVRSKDVGDGRGWIARVDRMSFYAGRSNDKSPAGGMQRFSLPERSGLDRSPAFARRLCRPSGPRILTGVAPSLRSSLPETRYLVSAPRVPARAR